MKLFCAQIIICKISIMVRVKYTLGYLYASPFIIFETNLAKFEKKGKRKYKHLAHILREGIRIYAYKRDIDSGNRPKQHLKVDVNDPDLQTVSCF